jgi:hypothetical protein
MKHSFKTILVFSMATFTLIASLFVGVKRGFSAVGYRHLEEKDFDKAMINFTLADDKKGQGSALISWA